MKLIIMCCVLIVAASCSSFDVKKNLNKKLVLKGPGKRDIWFMNQRRGSQLDISISDFKNGTNEAVKIRKKSKKLKNSIRRVDFRILSF